MSHGPEDLRAAIDSALAGRSRTQLAASVAHLSRRYRAGGAASAPITATPEDVAAYAAYRMPATYAACHRALSLAVDRWPGTVSSVLDLGGGTGACAWAAADLWPDADVTIAEQAPAALALGRALDPGFRFEPWRLGAPITAHADLVTASYVLSELTENQQRQWTQTMSAAAEKAVFIIEPGTPDGYERIINARTHLLHDGWHLAAPCPHELACPLQSPDWCHFAARVERSALHRSVKGGDLSYEDEKFAFLFAARSTVSDKAGSRILRHPVKRKGLVELQLCRPDGSAGRGVVTKRNGSAYKIARDARWGDALS